MIALALATVVAAAAPSADVLVLDLKPVGVDEKETQVLDGLFAEAIGRQVSTWRKPPKVATSNDIRTLISLEESKAAVGCDDASCLAEIAGAFGAHYVVTGTLGKLGSELVLQGWIFDVTASQTLARASVTATDPAALAGKLDELAARVLQPLAGSPASSASSASSSSSSSPSPDTGLSFAMMATGGGIAAVAGLVAAGTGAYALLLDSRLAARSGATASEKREALETGPAVVYTAIGAGAGAAAGLAVLGVGAAMGGE